MPIYNGHFVESLPAGGQRLSPTTLAALGPILAVSVSIPQALAAFYTRQQIPLPSPITGLALVDTGATRSCVHAPIMSNLGVNPIGVVTSGTPAGQVLHSLYPAHFTFPATNIEVDFTSVVGVDLSGQILTGHHLTAFIPHHISP